jgi:CelD/BcsL family acetyltransferase involved in cellulose biosynthesis
MRPATAANLDGLRFLSFRNLPAVEPTWRALETAGIATPYQRFEWVRAWRLSLEAPEARPFAALVIADAWSAPLALFPVEIDRLGPARVARFCGGKHANFAMPVLDRGFARHLDPARTPALLRRLADVHGGIDIFAFPNQPPACGGISNPFAQGPHARPSPEPVATTSIAQEGVHVVERVMSKESRKKLARKARWLAELGPVTYRRGTEPADVDLMLDAFFDQRARRCAVLDVPNPFAAQEPRQFLRLAAKAGLERGEPAIEVHALTCGERIVAVFGATTDGRWLSGSFISHETEPAFQRCSPGELLLFAVLRDAGARGFESFDLGVGGGAYKASFCKEPMAMADCFTPATMLGRAVAPLMSGAGTFKAVIKRDPRLLRMAQRLAPMLGAA